MIGCSCLATKRCLCLCLNLCGLFRNSSAFLVSYRAQDQNPGPLRSARACRLVDRLAVFVNPLPASMSARGGPSTSPRAAGAAVAEQGAPLAPPAPAAAAPALVRAGASAGAPPGGTAASPASAPPCDLEQAAGNLSAEALKAALSAVVDKPSLYLVRAAQATTLRQLKAARKQLRDFNTTARVQLEAQLGALEQGAGQLAGMRADLDAVAAYLRWGGEQRGGCRGGCQGPQGGAAGGPPRSEGGAGGAGLRR
ncbi:MAG: hypothetical protein J3K34DRAFT_63552 [Monoraphidium minutum]|nr:MAG: hypothetical protein J3K34DRAFT_63552 [Monoraphidium minutum]